MSQYCGRLQIGLTNRYQRILYSTYTVAVTLSGGSFLSDIALTFLTFKECL